jgi:hypothetical protein
MMQWILFSVLVFSIVVNVFLSILLIRGIVREGYVELPKRRKEAQLTPHEKAILEWQKKSKKKK